MEHVAIPAGERHQPHNFEYSNEAEREAATITDATLIHSLALQLDDGSYWRLTGVSPAVWTESGLRGPQGVPGNDGADGTGAGTVTSVAALTLGTSGTDLSSSVSDPTGDPVITLNVPTASASNRGVLSTADWAAFNAKQAALGFTPEDAANKSTNATADAASNTKYPSVKAIVDYVVAADIATLSAAQSYADGLVVGLLDDRGNHDASANTWPSSGGSGTAGAILKGDLWTISVAGLLGGGAVTAGDVIRAKVDAPGSTAGNWVVTENNLGYVPENSASKDASGGYVGMSGWSVKLRNAANTFTNFLVNATTAARTWTMPDKDGTVAMISDITGTNSGTNTGDETGARVAALNHAATSKATPVDADEIPLADSAATFGLKKLTWANIKATLKTYFDSLYLSSSFTNTREKLTAARTYYVRTDGNDSNTGLANISGGAFLTIQKAVNVASSLDFGEYNVTVQVGDGTYTGPTSIPKCATTGGLLIINGNAGTPSNVLISTTSANCFSVNSGGYLQVSNLKLQTTTSGSCLSAVGIGSTIALGAGCVFGASASAHMYSQNGALVQPISNYSITAGGTFHIYCLGARVEGNSITCTITGTPAFSSVFVLASNLGYVRLVSNTYSGSATGTRYNVSVNSLLDVNGAGATYLPGSVAGSAGTGGQYI